jgi:cell division protein FtsN
MRHSKRAKNRRKTTKGSSGNGHGWAWLLFGVVLGSVLGSIGYLKWYESRPHTLPPVAAVAKKAVKMPKPQFDFYTLLPDVKVDAPRKPGAAPAPKAPAVATTETTPAKNNYRLQVAAFKSYPEADAMKARLALSGFTLEIQSVKLQDGKVWYRVQTPPLSSQQEALKVQSALKAQAITSVVMTSDALVN